MEGIEEHKGSLQSSRLGRIEIRGRDRGVKGNGQLSLRFALREGIDA
jgi:hypothetical protein